MNEIERDQLLCAAGSRGFVQPRENKQHVEIKANWSRTRKRYGPTATDLVVSTNKNPEIDVSVARRMTSSGSVSIS